MQTNDKGGARRSDTRHSGEWRGEEKKREEKRSEPREEEEEDMHAECTAVKTRLHHVRYHPSRS